MTPAEVFNKQTERFVGAHRAYNEAIEHLHTLQFWASFRAVVLFFGTCGWLWWTGRLTAGALVATLLVVFAYRRVFEHVRIGNWSRRRAAQIEAEFPKEPTT